VSSVNATAESTVSPERLGAMPQGHWRYSFVVSVLVAATVAAVRDVEPTLRRLHRFLKSSSEV
jgi:hypothetical protein